MRVSNTVKDCIRSELRKKYPTDRLPEYENACNLFYDFEDELTKKINDLIKDEISAFRADNPIAVEADLRIDDAPVYRTKYGCRYVRYDLYKTACGEADRRHADEMRDKQDEAFNNIILTLELGGTKVDLDRILAELK